MRAWLLFVLLLLMAVIPAAAQETPDSLRECTTEVQVLDWLDMPYEDEGGFHPVDVRPGYIRYIAQDADKDPLFCPDYWCSVEPGENFDLNATKSRKGNIFRDHAATMCTRAVYAMAIGYLGYAPTPGDMSVMVNDRNIDDPYDAVTALLPGLERITHKSHVFATMFANYMGDSSYSPVYVYLRKPSGIYHALLVVGVADEEGYYLVVDPAAHRSKEDEVIRVYRIRFNVHYRKIINSTFRNEHRDSRIVAFYQWRRTDAE